MNYNVPPLSDNDYWYALGKAAYEAFLCHYCAPLRSDDMHVLFDDAPQLTKDSWIAAAKAVKGL